MTIDDITLTWTELDEDDPLITGGNDIVGYELEFKTSEGDDKDLGQPYLVLRQTAAPRVPIFM